MDDIVRGLVEKKIFKYQEGRLYKHFTHFKRDPLKNLDASKVYTWITDHKLIYIALTLCKNACKLDCDVKSGIDPLPF